MATPQSGTSLDAIATLLKLFQGEKTKTTETGGGFSESSQTKLDQTALAGLLKQALESNQGLAAVSQGQRSAGLYNSSTNRLLSNDLLARLTANTAAAGAEKVTTRTGTPATRTQVQGGMGGNNDILNKLILGMSAYQKLGGTKALKEGASMLGVGSSIPMTDMVAANASQDSIGSLAASQGWFDAGPAASQPSFSALDFAGLGGDSFQTLAPENWQAFDFTDPTPVATPADVEVPVEDTSANFPSAPSGNPSSANNPTAGETLEGATSASANTTSISASSAGGSVASLGMGIYQLTDDNSKNDVAGAVNTASGAYGTYKAADALSNGASLDFASNSGGGSVLGYIGPVMSAINAERNPEGVHGKDYRHAVGSAVLNYFGYGWAAPIVHEVAQPALNAAMDAGEESLGMFGAVLADPVGAPLSGEYKVEDLVQSTLDPGNIFGGNPGGSVGALVGASVDPVGAALGDKGVFSVVSDSVNSVDKAIGGALGAPGRVVCTELALGGELPMEKYQQVIQPKVTLKGRILLGYHVLGVPAVRKLRKDKKFRERALPYVNAYLDHKLGKWNWRGFLIKSIGEPLCWCLSFFNRDPDYYQTLYPYRRVRNG